MTITMPQATKLWCDREGRMTPHKFMGHAQSPSDQVWYPAYSCDSGNCFHEKLLIPGEKIRPGEYVVSIEKNVEKNTLSKKKSLTFKLGGFLAFLIIFALFLRFFA